MEAAIDLMLEIGPDVIERRVLALADQARAILRDLGATVAESASPVVAARFQNHDVSALARALKEKRVLVAARRGHLRVSPHLYNNEQDLEIFERTLRALL
jgi:cysteine desulfurase/selenocysteine lyase